MDGRLTRSFFETELRGLAEAYGSETGAARVTTEIVLRDGLILKTEGQPTCTETYIIVDHKSGNHLRRTVVPYGSILGVTFTGDSSGGMGFHR